MIIGFWDIAPIIYMVGLVIAFVLVYDRLAKPECYRIPFALFVAALWPIAVVIALVLYIEGLVMMFKEWLIGEDC
jgi:hypothetical protein